MEFTSNRKELIQFKNSTDFPVYRYAVLYYPSYLYDVLVDDRQILRDNPKKIEELETEFAIRTTTFLESEEERLELFTIAGVADPLQNAIHNLQRILRKQELTPELQFRLLKYSKWYDTEPERLYTLNRNRITENLKKLDDKESYNNILLICEMGITPERKSLLLLRGAHYAHFEKDRLPTTAEASSLNTAYADWLEDSGNYLLKRLSQRILAPGVMKK